MRNKTFPYIIFLIIVLLPFTLSAQEKFEKESRISQRDVPLRALQFIDSLQLKRKIKWYKEEGLNKQSIEAKFKHNKAKYSVEFDTLGRIEDVEIEINCEGFSTQLKDAICTRLQNDCVKFTINKVQIQYTGNESALLSTIKTNKVDMQLTINYELIIKCTMQNNVALYEYLFSATGEPLSISKIIFKPSSHLEY